MVRTTLARLARRGELHQIVKDLFYPPDAMARLAALAREVGAQHAGEVQAGTFRDATGQHGHQQKYEGDSENYQHGIGGPPGGFDHFFQPGMAAEVTIAERGRRTCFYGLDGSPKAGPPRLNPGLLTSPAT